MSGHKCCRLKSVLLLHSNTALPIQFNLTSNLSVEQIVIEVPCAMNALSWPQHVKQSSTFLLAVNAVAVVVG